MNMEEKLLNNILQTEFNMSELAAFQGHKDSSANVMKLMKCNQ
jgi:hypothetical protein